MKQRLGLAMALLGSPDVLLLDEPFNGLDPEATRAMRNLIVRVNETSGITVVVSSHVLDQLDRMATRSGVIADGRMVREMTAAEVAAECRSSLRVRTENPARALALLEEAYPALAFKAEPDGAIVITGAVSYTHLHQLPRLRLHRGLGCGAGGLGDCFQLRQRVGVHLGRRGRECLRRGGGRAHRRLSGRPLRAQVHLQDVYKRQELRSRSANGSAYSAQHDGVPGVQLIDMFPVALLGDLVEGAALGVGAPDDAHHERHQKEATHDDAGSHEAVSYTHLQRGHVEDEPQDGHERLPRNRRTLAYAGSGRTTRGCNLT